MTESFLKRMSEKAQIERVIDRNAKIVNDRKMQIQKGSSAEKTGMRKKVTDGQNLSKLEIDAKRG